MTTKKIKLDKDALTMMEEKFGTLTFAKALLAWRESESLSQVQFAEQLDLSVQSLCDLEKGRRIPSPSRAAKIAIQIGLSKEILIQLALMDSLRQEGFSYKVILKK